VLLPAWAGSGGAKTKDVFSSLYKALYGAALLHVRCTAMQKLRIVILRFGTARQKRVLERWTNPKTPSARLQIVPLSNSMPRGFGCVHHSRTILYH
jgi:hypothetical protein